VLKGAGKPGVNEDACSGVMEMLVHVACCMTIRPVKSQIEGLVVEDESSLAERRRVSHS